MAEVEVEVERVSGKMQFDTERARVRATYEMAVEGNKAVASFTGEIGVTNAELGIKAAVGYRTPDMGFANAELGKEEAAGSNTKQTDITKAKLEIMDAAGSCTREIGVAKAEVASGNGTKHIGLTKATLGSKEADSSCTGEIGVAKAELRKEAAGNFTSEIVTVGKDEVGTKEAAGSYTSEIALTKTKLGNKEAAGSLTSEIAVTKSTLGNKETAGVVTGEDGRVTEAMWIQYVFLTKPPAWFKPNAEPMGASIGATITKEKVPDSFVNILKDRRLLLKMPPVDKTSPMYSWSPELLDTHLAATNGRNNCVDLHADILKQLKEKKCPEVGVDYTGGVKKVFVLAE